MRSVGWFDRRLVVVCVAASALVAACGSDDAEEPTPSASPELANPASEYCIEQGGELELVDGDDGVTGVCVLPDGTRVDEWEYYRENVTSEP